MSSRFSHPNQPDWRRQCVAWLQARYGATHGPVVAEYIREAEHQDGRGYWQAFATLEDVDADFRLYMESLG